MVLIEAGIGLPGYREHVPFTIMVIAASL